MTDNVRFAYKNHSNVASLYTKLKDKLPIHRESNVVYQVDCTNCNENSYIGTTSQNVESRMNQHERDVEKGRQEKSALAHHAITHNHTFDFAGVKIFERERNWEKRMLLEEMHIESNKNCVSKRSIESKNISDIYSKLLQTTFNIQYFCFISFHSIFVNVSRMYNVSYV